MKLCALPLMFYGLTLLPSVMEACSIIYPYNEVAPSFRVRVEDRGHPVVGLPLHIKGYPAVVTDDNGIAAFKDISPGNYFIFAAEDEIEGAGAAVNVRASGPANIIVPLQWPYRKPIAARTLRGVLRGPYFRDGVSQPTLSLDLFEARTHRKLKSVQTNARGEFDAELAGPGIYILRLNSSELISWDGSRIGGDIVVDVDPSAKAPELDLDLSWTSCGLDYSNAAECVHEELSLNRFSGSVVYQTGGSISASEITLFDSAKSVVEQLESGRDGKFASKRVLLGTYLLEVRRPGFTPYRGVVRIDPNAESRGAETLNIQLGLGHCSTARVQ